MIVLAVLAFPTLISWSFEPTIIGEQEARKVWTWLQSLSCQYQTQMVRGFIERSQVISNQQVKPQVKPSPALTAQLEGDEFSTLLIIQSFRPDWFFSTEQQQRLSDLKNLWRTARDVNIT